MDRYCKRLMEYFRTKVPDISLEMETVWSGMLGVSKDLLPIMGRDAARETIWYAGAATGLPWAAALGIYAADRVISGRNDFDKVFSPRRRFTIGPRVQSLLSTPVTYAISHGMVKYPRRPRKKEPG
jgi:glycine/D-amino acid oxidase-like deaminating enzyme